MSAETEVDRGPESEAVLETVRRWYHVPVLLGLVAYMLRMRTQAYDNFVRDGDVFFRGNDAYYHFRATMYSVRNWPERIYADPYTYFPYGHSVGHFGTLYDQFWATVALLYGLGDPTSRQVATIAVLAPAIVGALALIPTYAIAKQISGDRIAGLVAAALLMLFPQAAWVTRSTVGFYDHHVAETLMMGVAVVALVHGLVVVQRERPVYEQLVDRDWEGLRPSLQATALGGVGLALYMMTWPSGIVLAGIYGVFLIVATCVAVLRGESPEHLAFAGVVPMLVALLVVLPFVQSFAIFQTTTLSLLHVFFLPTVAGGAAFLAGLARYWDREQLATNGYPAAVGAVGVVAIGIGWLVLPEVVDTIWGNMQSILFLGQSDTAQTIGEAQSMDTSPGALSDAFFQGYGFAAFTGVGALAWLGGRTLTGRRVRDEHLFVVVWSVFLVLMSITQVRFHYYLVVAAAVLNGWLVAQVFDLVDFPSVDAPERIEAYHVFTVLAVVLLLFAPITAASVTGSGPTASASERAGGVGPGSVQAWDGNLEWMANSTPTPGEYGGTDNELPYYGPWAEFGEGDYQYPQGAYGVMSWWDYGHWITTEGERIPNANPFQQGPRSASSFLQAQNETRANLMLDALPAEGGQLYGYSTEELRQIVDDRTDQQAGEETRYVMIDAQMAGGKFQPIAEWAGPGMGEYRDRQQYEIRNESVWLNGTTSEYDSTMLSRLYFQNANGLEHYRLVKESSADRLWLSVAVRQQGGSWQPLFAGLDQATIQQYFPQVLQALIRGDQRVTAYENRRASAVKTFERVEGANLTGQTEPNTTVAASVQLEAPNGPRGSFSYVQQTTSDEDGSFELTVPYSTDNQLGPDQGFTDTSVVANGTYSVFAGSGFQPVGTASGVEVPEPAIYQGEEIQVELEEPEGASGNGSQGGISVPGNESSDSEGTSSGSSAASGAASSAATASGSASAIAGARPVAGSSGG